MWEQDFEAFKDRIDREFMHHPVVVNNAYTKWFAAGELSLDHLRHFTVQFSVFSNQFLLAALNRVINADSLQAARESKEILMNELGVIYNTGAGNGRGTRASLVDADRGARVSSKLTNRSSATKGSGCARLRYSSTDARRNAR